MILRKFIVPQNAASGYHSRDLACLNREPGGQTRGFQRTSPRHVAGQQQKKTGALIPASPMRKKSAKDLPLMSSWIRIQPRASSTVWRLIRLTDSLSETALVLKLIRPRVRTRSKILPCIRFGQSMGRVGQMRYLSKNCRGIHPCWQNVLNRRRSGNLHRHADEFKGSVAGIKFEKRRHWRRWRT